MNTDEIASNGLGGAGRIDMSGFDDAVSDMRLNVAKWNERVTDYRLKTDKPIPEKVFAEHPAFESLKWIMSGLFFGSGEEEISSHAAFLLSRVSKDGDGNMLYDGKGEEGIYAWMDACARSAKIYAQADDIAKCALMDQNVELGGYLHALLFAEGEIAETPFAIAVREASYG